MPLKEIPKGNEANCNNSFWALATEEARLEYTKEGECHCNRLYLPVLDFGTPKRTVTKKLINEYDQYSATETLPNTAVADETLYTSLRIHRQENESRLFSSTKSKANHWPWLVACRSAFIHPQTLSLCKIGIKLYVPVSSMVQ